MTAFPATPPYVVGQVLDVRFPRVNKNDTLAQNDEYAKARPSVSRAIIKKTLYLGSRDFAHIGDSLLDDRGWMFECIGGAGLLPDDEVVFNAMARQKGRDPEDFRSVCGDQDLMNWFRQHCVVEVVAVVNRETSDAFFVNTEGYEYARYVGRAA